jgi:hypothetical protein
MQVHVMFVNEKSVGWCTESGWFWLFFSKGKGRFLRARGPFKTKDDAINTALRINPSAEVVSWDSSLAAPNIVTSLPRNPQPIFHAA